MVAAITEKQVQAEYVATALGWWRESNGVVSANDRKLDRLFGMIQICANGNDVWPPEYLYIGQDCEILQLYGPDFCKTAPGQRGVPDAGYENAVNGGYLDAAASRQAHISHVKGRTVGLGGTPLWMEYQRLILPGSLSNGVPVFLTFAKLIRLFRIISNAKSPTCRLKLEFQATRSAKNRARLEWIVLEAGRALRRSQKKNLFLAMWLRV